MTLEWLWRVFCVVMTVLVGASFFYGAGGCGTVTASDRERATDYAIKALQEGCPVYQASPNEWRRSPELDRVCAALYPETAEVPADAGDGG